MPEIIFLVALSLVRQLPCCFSFCWCASCTGQLCADCYLRFFDTVPIDGQGETRRVQTQTAADQKRVLIIAEMHARRRVDERQKPDRKSCRPAPLRKRARGSSWSRVPTRTSRDRTGRQRQT